MHEMGRRNQYHSTPHQMEKLQESMAWKDISEELDIWIEMSRAAIDDIDLEVPQRVQDKMRGILDACRNFKIAPSMLLQNMLTDAKHDRKAKERDKKKKTKKDRR